MQKTLKPWITLHMFHQLDSNIWHLNYSFNLEPLPKVSFLGGVGSHSWCPPIPAIPWCPGRRGSAPLADFGINNSPFFRILVTVLSKRKAFTPLTMILNSWFTLCFRATEGGSESWSLSDTHTYLWNCQHWAHYYRYRIRYLISLSPSPPHTVAAQASLDLSPAVSW